MPAGCAAVAAGAQGLLVEVHPNPDTALSDGAQSLTPKQFEQMVGAVGQVAKSIIPEPTNFWWNRNAV